MYWCSTLYALLIFLDEASQGVEFVLGYVVCTHGVFNKTRIADTTYTYSLWREERSSTCTARMVMKTGSRCGGRWRSVTGLLRAEFGCGLKWVLGRGGHQTDSSGGVRGLYTPGRTSWWIRVWFPSLDTIRYVWKVPVLNPPRELSINQLAID